MDKKSIRILMSLLHICLFAIGIVLIYFNTDTKASTKDTEIVLSDEQIPASETDTSSQSEPYTETLPEAVSEAITTEPFTEPIESETIEKTSDLKAELSGETVLYTFVYTKGKKSLNIRKTPSASGEIIGTIPHGGTGNILYFENDDWVYLEYNGMVGYCSLKMITVIEEKASIIY